MVSNDHSASKDSAAQRWLPVWVTENLHSGRSMKTFARCCVACWAAYVIMLPNASLAAMGSAAFFALLTSLFLPPYLPVQLFLFVTTTLVVGLLLGWGLGAAAMRAAVAVRNPAILQAGSAAINATMAANPDMQPTLAQTIVVFDGGFLDIRSSAIFGLFLGIGAFFFGLIRAYAPNLMFMSIFATISIDIFCTIGPLFPGPRYMILNSTLISVACYMAIATVATILIFPESMSHATLGSVVQQLGRISEVVTLQDAILSDANSGRVEAADRARNQKDVIVRVQKEIRAAFSFISLEFSWGRWNSEDVKSLDEPLLSLVSRLAGLERFSGLLLSSTDLVNQLHADPVSETTTVASSTKNDSTDLYLLQQLNTRSAELEAKHGVAIAEMVPVLDKATMGLRRTCASGLDATKNLLQRMNSSRWKAASKVDQELSNSFKHALEDLSKALNVFKTDDRLAVIDLYTNILAEVTDTSGPRTVPAAMPLRSLYISFVFAGNLLAVAESTHGLMQHVLSIHTKRSGPRLWAPYGLRAAWNLVSGRRGLGNVDTTFGDEEPVDDSLEKEDANYKLDPDSKPPQNIIQRIMDGIHHVYRWTGTAEGRFTLKYVFVTVALWLPAVVKRSANFYYVEKGIWALIMAQTTLNLYAADQIFNLVTRLVGTFIGLVIGLAAWYMGNGVGNGSVYGSAASVAVTLLPLVFVRIFAPPKYLAAIVLGCATYALVVGYSWVDGHVPQYATPGIGWPVAWKRFTLVAIGAGASFVMMMLPPTSGRKAVRLRTAKTLDDLARVYGGLVEKWIAPRLDGLDSTNMVRPNGDIEKASVPASDTRDSNWRKRFRVKLLTLLDEMAHTAELTELARWEGSARGAWPVEDYRELIKIQKDVLACLAQLGGALTHMEDSFRVHYAKRSWVLHPNFISDVMSVFSVLAQSLRTGEPVQGVLPKVLLNRLFYHRHHHQEHQVSQLDMEQLRSVDYMFYATAVVAVHQLLQSVDALHAIVRRLCGEVEISGFAVWRDDYERTRDTENHEDIKAHN